jgi:hypothetical protein
MSFEDIPFSSIPNFRLKETITTTSDNSLSSSHQFDCYKDEKGNVILIYPYFDEPKGYEKDFHICLVDLKTNTLIKALDREAGRILTIRHFRHPKTKIDYFVAAYNKGFIAVYDLSNDCRKVVEYDLKYEGFIHNAFLFYDPVKDKMYAVASSISSNNITKIVDAENQGSEIKEIQDSKDLTVYSLSYWYNEEAEEGKKHIIIQCGRNKILLSEFPSNSTYHKIETDKDFPYASGSIVFKNNGRDMLAVSITYGLVLFIDLLKKETVYQFKTEDDVFVHLWSFVRWNDQYLLLSDVEQRRIIVFDTQDGYKIKSKILCPDMFHDKYIKKIIHPIYGESILSVGIDWKLRLYVNRKFID